MSHPFRAPPLPPIPWAQAPITPLPQVIEDNSDAAWALFDAAQRARDPAPALNWSIDIKAKALAHKGAQRYLTPAEADIFLSGCESRMVLQPDYGWPGRSIRPEVKWEGRWLPVGCTSLYDEAGTYIDGKGIQWYRERAAHYGVIVTNDGFIVITSMTDG